MNEKLERAIDMLIERYNSYPCALAVLESVISDRLDNEQLTHIIRDIEHEVRSKC